MCWGHQSLGQLAQVTLLRPCLQTPGVGLVGIVKPQRLEGTTEGSPRIRLGPAPQGGACSKTPSPALFSSCRGCTKITHLCRWKEPGEPDHLASPQRPCLPQRATGELAAQAGCCCTAVAGPLTWSTWPPISQDRDHCPRRDCPGAHSPCLDAQTPLPSYLRQGLMNPLPWGPAGHEYPIQIAWTCLPLPQPGQETM